MKNEVTHWLSNQRKNLQNIKATQRDDDQRENHKDSGSKTEDYGPQSSQGNVKNTRKRSFTSLIFRESVDIKGDGPNK